MAVGDDAAEADGLTLDAHAGLLADLAHPLAAAAAAGGLWVEVAVLVGDAGGVDLQVLTPPRAVAALVLTDRPAMTKPQRLAVLARVGDDRGGVVAVRLGDRSRDRVGGVVVRSPRRVGRRCGLPVVVEALVAVERAPEPGILRAEQLALAAGLLERVVALTHLRLQGGDPAVQQLDGRECLPELRAPRNARKRRTSPAISA